MAQAILFYCLLFHTKPALAALRRRCR